MKVIVPCCGKSSRFPNMRPKWMLTHPDGNLIVKKAIEKLNFPTKDLVITILREHEDKYDITRGLKENLGDDIQVIVLENPTKSQSETVYETLKKANINEPFLVKDSDNIFSVEKCEEDFNYVCFSDLQEHSEINPGNKSYLACNENNIILNIVEKTVISRFFNVGGYFFTNPDLFKKTFEKLSSKKVSSEIYISHIIQDMILNQGEVFLGKQVSQYVDLGTIEDWHKYRSKFKTYFIDIDGIVFFSSAQHFKPRWADAKPIMENVEVLRELSKKENIQIFFVTSRTENFREITEQKLEELGIIYQGLIMGCFHANRTIINDFASTTKYPSCESINILRDSLDLSKYI